MFKIIYRNLLKNRTTSLLNILGLALAFTTLLFIFSWSQYEKSFDKFPDAERIYRYSIEYINGDVNRHWAKVWTTKSQEIAAKFPEIEKITRFARYGAKNFKVKEQKFESDNIFVADSNFLSVFKIPMSEGNPETALKSPNQTIISQSMAKKLFGNENPLGKQILLTDFWMPEFKSYTITGVFKDLALNYHFHPEIMVSYKEWDAMMYTYFLIKPHCDVASLVTKLQQFHDNIPERDKQTKELIHLQAVKDIHLESQKAREVEPNGDKSSLQILYMIGIIVLIIVFINHVNFLIASVRERHRYFMIAKIHGSKVQQFILLFSVESIVNVIIAAIIACLLFVLFKPVLLSVLTISLALPVIESIKIFLLLCAVFSIISILIGIYPAIILSFPFQLFNTQLQNIQPASFIKNRTGQKFRNAMVLIQFIGGICLIICGAIIYRQNNFLLSQRLGNEQNNIISFAKTPRQAVDKYNIFKEELLKNNVIQDVTGSMEEPAGEIMDSFSFELEGKQKDQGERVFILTVDKNFNSFFKNKLLAGMDFTAEKESADQFIINRTALKAFGFTKPEEVIGKRFKLAFPYDSIIGKGQIVGVIDDFHLMSLKETERPIVMYYTNFFNYSTSIKFDKTRPAEALRTIKEVWDKINPDYTFSSYFIDELYFKLYANQIKQFRFIALLTGIGILISCLGLFGNVIFVMQQRTKEIGIRKINGAKINEILFMLNKDILKWVVVAFIIACPIAFYVMHKWLQNFAYKTSLHWWIFVFGGALGFIIALLTVSWQSWRAATRNPVEALRYE